MPKVNGKEVGLLAFSTAFKKREDARNKYAPTDEYRKGHPNEVSDGDELGKDLGTAGTVGGRTDIAERKKELAKNPFSPSNPYDASKI